MRPRFRSPARAARGERRFRTSACANTPWPIDRRDNFLDSRQARTGARGDQLELPALGLGKALSTCGTDRRRTAPLHRRRCPRATSSIAARSSAASRGSSLDGQRALGLRKLVADLLRPRLRHFVELGLGGRIRDHAVQHVEFGAKPADFARRSRDRFDRGIVLGQPDEFLGSKGRRATSRPASSCLPRLDRRDAVRRNLGHRPVARHRRLAMALVHCSRSQDRLKRRSARRRESSTLMIHAGAALQRAFSYTLPSDLPEA